ncbi:hypothetical protein JCGZ_24122 [Jatropha curcas]|uniref:Uncharacterized protein n=1 Tax=Jatropha curcas TaxID=180498 RepID=A0A067LHI6_JATCU|nr:hypothetical protein JCGZ_24122 [Jatropha curcas]
MVHMRLVENVRDEFHLVGSQGATPDVEETEEASDTNMEEDIPHAFLVLVLFRNYAWEPRLSNRYRTRPISGNCQLTPNCDTVAEAASTSTT